MAIGIGMYLCSFAATFLVLICLVAFEEYGKRKKLGQDSKVINLTVDGILESIEDYKRLFSEFNIHLSTFYVEYDYEKKITELNFVILVHTYTNVLPILNKVRNVSPTKKLTLSNQIEI